MAQSFAGHTYCAGHRGHAGLLKVITRDDLDDYRKRIMARGTLRVAAVGDIDAATLGKVLDEVFGALPAEPQLTPVVDVQPKAVPKPTIVDVEGPQSVDHLRAARHRAHRPRLLRRAWSLSQLLGGGSSDARLVREVREKRGLSYWIYTLLYQLQAFDHADRRLRQPQQGRRHQPRAGARPSSRRWPSRGRRRRRSTRPRAT